MSDVLICYKEIFVLGSDEKLEIRIYKPFETKEDGRSSYVCPSEIVSTKNRFPKISYNMVGSDSVHALILTFRIIGNRLNILNEREYLGQLSQFDEPEIEPDFGFLPLN